RRFVNDARAAARLRHRNLIQLHDVGRLPNGAWFMVLDYLNGQTLSRFIATRSGPIAESVVLHIVCEIANGLHAAHARKIIHRNLEPDNIVVIASDPDPYHAVLLDFGVAMLGDDPGLGPDRQVQSGSSPGVRIGTAVYMSPEQLRGERVTTAADIF